MRAILAILQLFCIPVASASSRGGCPCRLRGATTRVDHTRAPASHLPAQVLEPPSVEKMLQPLRLPLLLGKEGSEGDELA